MSNDINSSLGIDPSLVIDPNFGHKAEAYSSRQPHWGKCYQVKKSQGSPYSITEHRVLELIPVLGRQPAGDMSQTWW